MKRRNYRGKRRGVSAEQAMVLVVAMLLAIVLMTTKAASEWTGQSSAELLREAVFETKDWE